MCTVLLPPGVNPIAVNKYINIIININSDIYIYIYRYRYRYRYRYIFIFALYFTSDFESPVLYINMLQIQVCSFIFKFYLFLFFILHLSITINKGTVISQRYTSQQSAVQSTLLHVSPLSCDYYTVYSQCLAKVHAFFKSQLFRIRL